MKASEGRLGRVLDRGPTPWAAAITVCALPGFAAFFMPQVVGRSFGDGEPASWIEKGLTIWLAGLAGVSLIAVAAGYWLPRVAGRLRGSLARHSDEFGELGLLMTAGGTTGFFTFWSWLSLDGDQQQVASACAVATGFAVITFSPRPGSPAATVPRDTAAPAELTMISAPIIDVRVTCPSTGGRSRLPTRTQRGTACAARRARVRRRRGQAAVAVRPPSRPSGAGRSRAGDRRPFAGAVPTVAQRDPVPASLLLIWMDLPAGPGFVPGDQLLNLRDRLHGNPAHALPRPDSRPGRAPPRLGASARPHRRDRKSINRSR